MDNRRTVLVLQLPLTCLRFGSSVHYDSVHIPGFNGMVYFHNQLVSSGRQAGKQRPGQPVNDDADDEDEVHCQLIILLFPGPSPHLASCGG